jgi:hypothetical protein
MIILALSALASLYLCYACVTNTSELSRLQAMALNVNKNRAIMNAVATDALEYSKTHPAIDPILEEAKIKPPSHPQAAAKTSK